MPSGEACSLDLSSPKIFQSTPNKQQTMLGMARAKHIGTAQHAHVGYSLCVYTAPDVLASAPPTMIICCTDDEFSPGKFGS